MNNSKNGGNDINELMKKASEHLNTTPEQLSALARTGRVESVLSPQQTERVKQILADENAIKKLLSSKQAIEIIKGLKKNE